MGDLSSLTNEELWNLFPIILEKHNPEWKNKYEEMKKVILKLADKDSISRISHIGSTCVPGLVSKPTIDILVELNKESNPDVLRKRMEDSGFGCIEVPSNPPPHIMFLRGYTSEGFKGQAYHVHLRFRGDWNELYFRDYLKENPETAGEYEKLKRELAVKYRNHRDSYTSAKGDFVRLTTDKARKLYKNRYK